MSVVGRISSIRLLNRNPAISIQVCTIKTDYAQQQWNIRKAIYAAIGLTVGGVSALIYTLDHAVKAYDWPLHPPKQPWAHNGLLSSMDHESIRRGFQVYRSVCATCHGLMFLPFRRLINVAYTADEIKDLAAEYQIQDGPDESGEMFMRPGKVADYFPEPYPNEEAAAAANNGAVPPDLSLIVFGREGGEDYIFSLLTGYCAPEDIPAGADVPENGYYNPYFQGSVIAMPPPLYNNVIEYEDGTPATQSQLAKDVVSFLAWMCEPHHEKRKVMGIKSNLWGAVFFIFLFYINRHKWSGQKARQIIYKELFSKNAMKK